MLYFPALLKKNQIKQPYSCSLTHQNPLLVIGDMQNFSLPSNSKFSASAIVETPRSTL